MDKWIEVKLSDIGKTYSGLSNKSAKDFGYGKDYIPYLNIYNNSKVNINFFEKVNIKKRENQNKVKYGDIFFTTSSETPDEVGMSSVLLDEVNEVYLNSFCFGFRLNDFNTLRPEFARYYFRGMGFRKQMNYLAQGSTRYNLSKVALLKYKAILPTIPEQSKIAEILTTIDDAIEQTEKIIAKYRRIKQGLLQDLLTKGIDENGNIRSEATHEFKDSPLGRIPVEWEVKKIGDICKVKGGKRLPKGEKFSEEKFGYPYIRVTDFRNNSVDIKNIEYISQEVREVIKNYTISKEDVYISIAGTIGLVGTIPDCLDGANLTENAAKIMINDKKQVDKNFLVNTILFHGKKQIESSIGITSQPKLALFRIEQIFVVVPKIDEQRAIVDKFLKMNSLIDNEEDILVKLYSIKQGLMQDLLTGKVRVTHLLDKGGKSDECHP